MRHLSDNEYTLLKEHLRQISGIDVPAQKRYLFTTRLEELLDHEGFATFDAFYRRIAHDNDRELECKLIQAMTTHESSFVRDAHPFESLGSIILPKIAARRLTSAVYLPPRIRILSAGCSLGQEPYSIAMTACEWLKTQTRYRSGDISIMATDISHRVLARAKEGVYTELEMGKHLDKKLRDKYFVPDSGKWRVCDELRQMIAFSFFNLNESIERLGLFDIIFCRNVIIYFSQDIKRRILDSMSRMLVPPGVLFLGASESLYQLCDRFTAETNGRSMWYSLVGEKDARAATKPAKNTTAPGTR